MKSVFDDTWEQLAICAIWQIDGNHTRARWFCQWIPSNRTNYMDSEDGFYLLLFIPDLLCFWIVKPWCTYCFQEASCNQRRVTKCLVNLLTVIFQSVVSHYRPNMDEQIRSLGFAVTQVDQVHISVYTRASMDVCNPYDHFAASRDLSLTFRDDVLLPAFFISQWQRPFSHQNFF